MFGLSFWEIGLIALVALVVLGPKRLPALAKTLGKGLRELRKASTDLRSAIEEPLQEVRRPLEDMRDDLVETVYRIEDEVETAAGADEALEQKEGPHPALAEATETGDDAPAEAGDEAAPEDDAEPVEVEDRRRQVEAVYSAGDAHAGVSGEGDASDGEQADPGDAAGSDGENRG